MEITQHNIKRAIISQIPELELYHESIIHNKVHYNKFEILRVIPEGSKGFLIFKKDRTGCYCYFIELLSKKSVKKERGLFLNYKNYTKRIAINRIYKFNCDFDELLTVGSGTILYGTLCWNDNIKFKTNLKYFIVENILYFKGRRIYFSGWNNLFKNINDCIYNYISNTGVNRNSLIICNVITKQLPTDINSMIDEIQYNIYCIQYIRLSSNKIYFKTVNKIEKEYMFLKAGIQSDIYELYDKNDKYIGICHIPDYKTSVRLNNIFRDIKENRNLDYIEESDDEDEFENISFDKYVDLDKKELFECVYNKKFNMWMPLKHIDEYEIETKKYNIYKIKY